MPVIIVLSCLKFYTALLWHAAPMKENNVYRRQHIIYLWNTVATRVYFDDKLWIAHDNIFLIYFIVKYCYGKCLLFVPVMALEGVDANILLPTTIFIIPLLWDLASHMTIWI